MKEREDNMATTLEKMTDTELRAEVERLHAELYPKGCPLMCEACAWRLGRSTRRPVDAWMLKRAAGEV